MCPVFGVCGGCAYQDLPYEEELRLKETWLKRLLGEALQLDEAVFEPIVPSPEPYHYRTRLDLTFLKTRKKEHFLGFMPEGRFQIVPIESCAIARRDLSDFLPALKKEAEVRLPADYRVANLVVKTGDDGRILWGGIGRRSLELAEQDYLFVEVCGKIFFYSLDSFFQANHSILPALIRTLHKIVEWDRETTLFDLYSGVGLFGICLAGRVNKVIMIEENASSIELAKWNVRYHGLEGRVEILAGKVENALPNFPVDGKIDLGQLSKGVALVDPPRKGLSPAALKTLTAAKSLNALLYLSCSPESLARDLAVFVKGGWKIEKVVPFDFFPKTKHLETLVLLRPESERFSFAHVFKSDRPVEMEIGCGKGKFLIARAERYPEINFLGLDRINKWMNIGRGRAQKRKFENLHFLKAECREFLRRFAPASVSARTGSCGPDSRSGRSPSRLVSVFHIYFPDPWPKRRHRNRRLVTAEFLKLLYERLAPFGLIEMATDDADYFLAMKRAMRESGFAWRSMRESVNERLIDPDLKTNYELKYTVAGKPLYYLELQK